MIKKTSDVPVWFEKNGQVICVEPEQKQQKKSGFLVGDMIFLHQGRDVYGRLDGWA